MEHGGGESQEPEYVLYARVWPRMKAMVVSDYTGRAPSVVTAFIRNVLKGVLGLISLLAMAASSRQKALHDLMVGTTVQARDLRYARLKNFTKVRRSPVS